MGTKAKFVVQLMQWISHKNLIHSRSKYLPSQKKREALRFINEAFKPCRENSAAVPLQSIARLVLHCEPQLRIILPSIYNAAYKSSLSNLESIIDEAKKITNTPASTSRIQHMEVVVQSNQKKNS